MRFSLSVLLFIFLIAYPFTVDAHVLKSSGTIGAVMHITPEDDPIAGEQSDFFFEFKDKEGRFQPEDCECVARVFKAGKEIFNQPLFSSNADPSLANASFSFSFPERGIYKVNIAGKPKNDNEFNSFSLEYELRIERESEKVNVVSGNSTSTPESNWLWEHIIHLAGGLTIVGFLIFSLVAKNKRKAAVIFLAFVLVTHSVPLKAIHASHNGNLDHQAYVCCLPVSAVLADEPNLVLEENSTDSYGFTRESIRTQNLIFKLLIRPPPLS